MPPKGERRKQQIIDTAKNMFIERGFQSTHIGQVCDELNIARGTVYQYFNNKKEILIALLDSIAEKIKDILDQDDLNDFLKKNKSSGDIENFIRSRIVSATGIILNEPIVIKLIFKDIQGIDEDITAVVDKVVQKIKNFIAEEIKKWIELKVFKNNLNADITASMLVGGVMLLIYEYGKKNKNILEKESVDAIVENYLNGAFKKN